MKNNSFRINFFFIFGLFGFIWAHLSKQTHRRSTGYPIINTRDFQKLLTLKPVDKQLCKSNSRSVDCVKLKDIVRYAQKNFFYFLTFLYFNSLIRPIFKNFLRKYLLIKSKESNTLNERHYYEATKKVLNQFSKS